MSHAPPNRSVCSSNMAMKQDLEEYEVTSKFGKMKLDDDQSQDTCTCKPEIPVPVELQDKPEFPVTVEIVTWNTNSSKQVFSTKDFSAIRDILIRTVKEPIKHCITVLQEVEIGAKAMRDTWGFGDCILAMPLDSGLREAAVSTPPKGKRLQHVTGDILNEPVLKTKGVKEEFAKRMCGQQVTLKKKIGKSEYTASITVVSYHAQYKASDKFEKMLEYFEEMCKFADILEQTIIIGGDFNLPVVDWKNEVEDKFKPKVSVALYVGTPRRWHRDRLIDTFAVVQPSKFENQTKATFEETMGIYQFPMVGRVGGDEPTALRDYPSSKNRWFKYVHFNDEDLQKIKDALAKKAKDNLKSIEEKLKGDTKEKKTKKDVKVTKEDTEEKMKQVPEEDVQVTDSPKENELPEETPKDAKKKEKEQSKEDEAEGKKKSPEETKSKLEEIKKDIEGDKHLSKPFIEANPPWPPAPLWPNSCLHQVLDHDPVLTRVKVTLKRNDSAQGNTPTTPEKRVTRSTKKD